MATSFKTNLTDDKSLVKTDPDNDVNMTMDDEGYEDTGDLEIPQPLPEAWLARLPQMVYDKWNNLKDDDEITLGQIWQYPKANKWYLVLDETLKQNEGLPKRQKMHVGPENQTNTFVFSEQDLPEKKRNVPKQEDSQNATRGGRIHKFSRYRRTVPKQTKLQAVIRREVVLDATDSTAYRKEIQKQLREEDKAKMGFIEEDPADYHANFTLQRLKDTSDVGVGAVNKDRRRALDSRAARIPENELLDRIFACFKKFRFWKMASLRQEINQPQEYLRETLLKVADFVKSGVYYNTYTLKPEYAHKGQGATETEAPEPEDVKDEGESTAAELSDA